MALGTAATIALSVFAASSAVSAGAGILQQRKAEKRAKSQARDAAAIREQEKKKAEALATRGEGLSDVAKTKAAAIAAGKKRKRGTLATGPRGLLDEPEVTKPGLLGEG